MGWEMHTSHSGVAAILLLINGKLTIGREKYSRHVSRSILYLIIFLCRLQDESDSLSCR